MGEAYMVILMLFVPYLIVVENSFTNLIENPQRWDPCLFDGDSSL